MVIPKFCDIYYLTDEIKRVLVFTEYFDEYESIAIMLGFDPALGQSISNDNYSWFNYPMNQLRTDVANNRLKKSTVETHYYSYGNNEYFVYKIHKNDLIEWACFHGYKIDLPKYKPFNPKAITNDEQTAEALETQNNVIQELYEKIAQLTAENEQLKQSATSKTVEFEGDIPPKTNQEKLADFITLIAKDELKENGGMLPYSRVHTKLTQLHRDKRIPSKNTIGKYLNQLPY